MKFRTYLAGFAFAAISAAYAQAEEVDCKDPQTQTAMTQCAQVQQDAADKALNNQYKLTRAAMVAMDKNLDDAMKGAEKSLIGAQRAWVAFRDAECNTAGFQARGGTMEPMLVANCITELTQDRTKQLKALADDMGQ